MLLQFEDELCMSCEFELPVSPFLKHENNPVRQVFEGRIPLEFANSFLLFKKVGLSQKLIHQLKYKGNQNIGVHLGELFGEHLKGTTILPDALVPVPLHPDKEKLRGYNQSLCIAVGLGKALGVPVDDDLVFRTKKNISQTRLNRIERWQNVEGIFKRTPKPCPYKYVWIIDDTLTTGSTLEACAVCFEDNVKIGIATLAYAD